MKNIAEKISNIIENATAVINSDTTSNNLKKGLSIIAMATAVAMPTTAFADSAENYSIVGENKNIVEHINSVANKTGISLNQNSNYLNNENELHKEINNFIEFAYENYSPERFNEIEELVNKAQKHFDNGLYNKIDQYAEHLTSTLSDSAFFLVESDERKSLAEKYENVNAVVDLFQLMDEEPNFEFAYWVSDIEKESLSFSKPSAKENIVDYYNIVSIDKEEHNVLKTGLPNLSWAVDNYDLDTAVEMSEYSNSKEFFKLIENAYDLNDKDIDFLENDLLAQQISKLIPPTMIGETESLLKSEISIVWNAVKSGASKGYLDFKKESNTLIYGLMDKGQSDYSIGLLPLFFDKYSHSEIKDMDIEDLNNSFEEFIEEMPKMDGYEQNGFIVANQSLQEVGAYPTLSKYLNKNLPHHRLTDTLNKSANISKNHNLDDLYTAQINVFKNSDSSMFDRFVANNTPNFLDYQTNDIQDYEMKMVTLTQFKETRFKYEPSLKKTPHFDKKDLENNHQKEFAFNNEDSILNELKEEINHLNNSNGNVQSSNHYKNKLR